MYRNKIFPQIDVCSYESSFFLLDFQKRVPYLGIIAVLGLVIEYVEVGVAVRLTVQIGRSRGGCHRVCVTQCLQRLVPAINISIVNVIFQYFAFLFLVK